MTFQELSNECKNLVNDYDWTLSFKMPRDSEREVEKRSVIYELQKVPILRLILEVWAGRGSGVAGSS